MKIFKILIKLLSVILYLTLQTLSPLSLSESISNDFVKTADREIKITNPDSSSPIKKTSILGVSKITKLTPPKGFTMAVAKSSDEDKKSCDSSFHVAPYTQPMNFISRYHGSDSTRSQINDDANQAYLEQTKIIREFETNLVQKIDSYISGGNKSALACSINLLYNWASSEALLTYDRNATGAAVRKWTLSSISNAYMRLKFSESTPLSSYKDKAQVIEDWFLKLANRVTNEDAILNYYDRVNNHTAWAANAVMVVSIILDNRELYNSSKAVFKEFIHTIDKEGMLPSELVRGSKALHYHAFSLMPLYSMAAILNENNYYFTTKEFNSIEKLTNTVFNDIFRGTKLIATKTGKVQPLDTISDNIKLSWIPPYCYFQTCSNSLLQKISSDFSIKTTRLGGPVNLFYQK